MATTIDHAALAAFVYNDQRGGGSENPTNKLILPDNWQDMSKRGFAVGDSLNAINPFSFTGGAYLNQATGEIATTVTCLLPITTTRTRTVQEGCLQ